VTGATFTFDETLNLPMITNVSPDTGDIAGGTGVTLTGTGFTGATSVTFGGVAGTGLDVNGDTSLTVTTPANSVGTVDVLVTTPEGTSASSDTAQFTYTTTLPLISSVQPSSGPTGTTVTLTGTSFTGATVVNFGDVPATPTNVTATAITVVAPSHAAGTVDLTVETPEGVSPESATVSFTYTALDTITYDLTFRWSLLAWGGIDGMDAADALAGMETPDNPETNSVANIVTAVFQWNGDDQDWEGYFPGSENIPGANDFTTLTNGRPYWLASTTDATWTIEAAS
jgi:hypothetical protein